MDAKHDLRPKVRFQFNFIELPMMIPGQCTVTVFVVIEYDKAIESLGRVRIRLKTGFILGPWNNQSAMAAGQCRLKSLS